MARLRRKRGVKIPRRNTPMRNAPPAPLRQWVRMNCRVNGSASDKPLEQSHLVDARSQQQCAAESRACTNQHGGEQAKCSDSIAGRRPRR